MEIVVLLSLLAGAFVWGEMTPNGRVWKLFHGGSGAVRSTVSYARGVNGASTNKKRKQPKSVTDALVKGYKRQIAVAQKKHADGTDWTGRTRRAAKVTGRGIAGVVSGTRHAKDEIKEGYNTAKDASIWHFLVRPAVDNAGRENFKEEEQEWKKSKEEEVFWEEEDVDGDKKNEEQQTTDGTTERGPIMAQTDLTSVDDYLGELANYREGVEAIIEPLAEIKDWGEHLMDRYEGAGWRAGGVQEANANIADAVANGVDPEALLAAIDEAIAAGRDAKAVGEVADEAEAEGDVDAFRSK